MVTSVAPRIVDNVLFVTRLNHEHHFSIWGNWRMIPDAPHIVLDVLYVTRINYEIGFAWQARLMKMDFRGRRSILCNFGRWPEH